MVLATYPGSCPSPKAPFPYFGGKSRAASLIWSRLGDVKNYVEAFGGSLAVLLGRPHDPRFETVNDLDGFIANFWRATIADPEGVAHYADWPVNEIDLTARHLWLVNRRDELTARLLADPDYHDAKTAGWWVWGLCCWIGSGWCSGNGPWQLVDGKLVDTRQLVHLGDAGMGVHRQLVRLGDAGMGVHRKRARLGDAGMGNAGSGEQGLYAWFDALAERLRRVRVCCGDWQRVLTPAVLFPVRHDAAITGVLLDPPYSQGERAMGLYARDSGSVAADVREWAIAHGDDPRLRIALCGYDTEHAMPGTWTAVPWKASGGYGSQAKARTNRNRFREVVWFSPHCLTPDA